MAGRGRIRILVQCLPVWYRLQVVHVSLKKRGLNSTIASVRLVSGISPRNDQDLLRIHRLAWRLSPWTTCLRRALVLRADVVASGKEAELVQGVRQSVKGPIEMHAWVEIDGAVFGDSIQKVSQFEILEWKTTKDC